MNNANQGADAENLSSPAKLTPVFALAEKSFDIYDKYSKQIIRFIIPFVAVAFLLSIPDLFFLKDSEDMGSLAISFVFVFLFSVVTFFLKFLMLLFFQDPDNLKDWKSILPILKKKFGPILLITAMIFVYLGLWFSLLFVPALVMSIYYYFAIWVHLYEGKNGNAAISASKNLVKGYWWAVFGRFLVFSLIVIVFYFGIDLISFGYLTWIVDVIMTPFMVIYFGQIYHDLVRIKSLKENQND